MVSVIVLNFNGADHLDDCLRSLCDQNYESLEVLVIDNGSSDDSKSVASRYPVRWEELGRNHGFAPGINLGVPKCRGDTLVFVNNDMRFSPTFVSSIVSPLLRNADVFAADARQMTWAGAHEIHSATRLRYRSIGGILRGDFLPLLDVEQNRVARVTECFQACAGNMAVRRQMFEALGGFDSRLPAGWEDTEIAWRAWARGWRTVFVPDAVCWHKVGATSDFGDGARIRFRGSLGGRLLFSTKYLPLEHVLLTWLAALGGLVGEMVRGQGRSKGRAAILRDYARLVPTLIRERGAFYETLSQSPRAYLRKMTSIGGAPHTEANGRR
jgi:GT2 family glycosyltransferase